MNLASLSPHSNRHMLTLPSVEPVAISSPVLPLETTVTLGLGTAHAVAFVTCKEGFLCQLLNYFKRVRTLTRALRRFSDPYDHNRF